jgi:hypothetical protein
MVEHIPSLRLRAPFAQCQWVGLFDKPYTGYHVRKWRVVLCRMMGLVALPLLQGIGSLHPATLVFFLRAIVRNSASGTLLSVILSKKKSSSDITTPALTGEVHAKISMDCVGFNQMLTTFPP